VKYPDDYINQIICGDCLEVMKGISNESINLIVTSPPYNKNGFRGRKDTSKGKGRWQNSNINYGEYEDNLPEGEYQKWQINIINKLHKLIKTDGSIFYNHKERRANNIVSHPLSWILKTEAKYWQEIIWNRLSTVDHNINYLSPVNELIFWLTKNKPKVFKKSGQNTIWNISPKPEKRHPAPLPLKLVKLCILLTTEKNDIVLDPFMGIGTVAIACKELGRNYIGIEISEEYCEIARRRVRAIPELLF